MRAAKRILLVVNEGARRGAGARAEVGGTFRSLGHVVIPVGRDALRDSDAAGLEFDGRVDLVAVAGGDGTVFSAVPLIRALGVPLLVVPLGTTNELARTLAIPLDIAESCALVDAGETRSIDLGAANGKFFCNEASIGLSTRVARAQTEELKRAFGMFAAPVAVLRSLHWMRPQSFAVEADGVARSFKTVQLTIANSNRFGGVVEDPQASLTDGKLNLYCIDVRHWRDALAILVAIVLRRFPEVHCVTNVAGTHFIVRSRNPEAVYADGEPATYTPAEFTIARAAIEVYVPKPAAATPASQ